MGVIQAPVGDRCHGHTRCDWSRVLRQHHQRHVAAVAPAEIADVRGIHEGLLGQPAHADHLIGHFRTAHAPEDGGFELHATPGAAAIVEREHDIAALRHHLIEQTPAAIPTALHVLHMRTAVDPDQHRVALAFVEAERLDHAVVESLAILGLEAAEFRRQVRFQIGVVGVPLLDLVGFEYRQFLAAGLMQPHLRWRVFVGIGIHEYLAVVAEHRFVPAVVERDPGG